MLDWLDGPSTVEKASIRVMTTNSPALVHPALARLKAHFPDARLQTTEFRGQTTIVVAPNLLHELLQFLRDDSESNYDFLSNVTGVDYQDYPAKTPGRFAVVYLLASTKHADRLRVKVFLDPSLDTAGIAVDPALELDSVTDLWAGAEWPERETFDMYGIRFRNHPDLRRILTWEDYPAHPLRKDYPLQGRLERENFNVVEADDA